MSVFVGLDCGGSSSRIMAVDQAGAILYQGHSGAANLVTTPEARLRRNLQHASAGCPSPEFVCGCFAGLINEHIRMRGIAHLREVFPEARLRAEPDYTAAFYASPPGTDVCVISGTGSLICSRTDGRIVKSGGRGYILGDEGSSYQFGRDAVAHYLQNPREASHVLQEAVLEHFGTSEANEIVASVYRSGTPASILGKFARTLGQDAQSEQPYAVKSLHRHLEQLADIVADHVASHFPTALKKLSVSLSGGLWKAAPIFREKFASILWDRLRIPELTVSRIAKPPLHGAVELAREMIIVN